MADRVKTEVSSFDAFADEGFEKEIVKEQWGRSEDVATMKVEVKEEEYDVIITETEVQEESYDFEKLENVTKLLDMQETVEEEYVWLPESEIKLEDERQLISENSSSAANNSEPHAKQKEKNDMPLDNQNNGCYVKTEEIPKCNEYGYAKNEIVYPMRHRQLKKKMVKCTYKNCKCTQLHPVAEDKPCECPPCEFVAPFKSGLQRHILAKHSDDEKKYKCDKCSYATRIKDKLATHVFIHMDSKPFKCDMCEYTCTRKARLQSHRTAKHGNAEEIHRCKECEFSTSIKINLIIHMDIHTTEKQYECDKCEYKSIRRDLLRNHILTKHGDGEIKYKCSECEYGTPIKKYLVKHMITHSDKKQFKCDLCDFVAFRKNNLRYHILVQHNNTGEKCIFKCNICDYAVATRSCLKDHKLLKHDDNGRNHKCDMCDFATVRKNYLRRHILTKHSVEEKKYKCEKCKYATHIKAHFVEHVLSHAKQKLFNCDICGFVTMRKNCLTNHVKHHIMNAVNDL